MARFDIRIDTLWIAPLLLVGATHAKSFVEVGSEEIFLKFGMGEEKIPLSNVDTVAPHEWSLFHGIGHRVGYDGMGYVGSTDGVVQIKLKSPQSFHLLLGMKIDLGNFYVSLTDPEGFMAAVGAAL